MDEFLCFQFLKWDHQQVLVFSTLEVQSSASSLVFNFWRATIDGLLCFQLFGVKLSINKLHLKKHIFQVYCQIRLNSESLMRKYYIGKCRKPKAWLDSVTAQYGNDPITDWILQASSGLQEDSTSWIQIDWLKTDLRSK